ncbi:MULTISPECIES: GNAT family N-acetyltransferase [Priestia]|uniref:GNAT family N-acetyltransferase n=1 Tax=Priestia TaxID=2800373 RepID=UPI001ADB7041|nr:MULTISPECIES: GNAT family N-acetyltransferase [Priestia]QTL51273.1 GNAT family N-acetyltransferase [Priestia aryabhattai]USL44258.1 GNAT family N-acetyltransferase [Priestia megaterium]
MIRDFNENDKDYIIDSHYKIYNKEYNYDLSFKEFISNSINQYIKNANSLLENIWILDIDGCPKGSISIKRVNEDVAQLGLFLVDPSLRGTGLGKQLVQTAIDFCKEKNYKKVVLWTNSELVAARRIYKNKGFQLIETRKQFLSNKELVEEQWELSL